MRSSARVSLAPVAELRAAPANTTMTAGQSVLILDGQTNQALACVRSLGRAGYRVLVASPLRWPLAGWSKYCSRRFHLTGETRLDYARLRSDAMAHGVNWVLPMTERACVLCNLERTDWEQAGIQVACASDETLENAFDKAATIARAVKCGVAIPPTRLPHSLEAAHEAASEIGYPCVIKPRFSFTWDGEVFLPHHDCAHVAQPDQLEAQVLQRHQAGKWPLVQGYVPGVGKGIFALCDRGRVVAWFAHERLREVRPTGSGSSLRRAIPLDPRLRDPAKRILGELRWHGPAMVEFRDDGIHAPWLMEINGRFWTSLELAIQAGVDFPRLWLEIMSGRRVETVNTYRTDVTLRWLWGDVKHLMFVLAGRPRGFTGPFPSLRRGLRDVLGPQPPGTRAETWQSADPWPALAEWIQGIREIISTARQLTMRNR